ncbi:hypothetical protein AQJ11_42430 [Streptomyces corchorusii]|uniref:Uncharacterized protein n=1 Tax=Streptomyces corchorusii TaxID=1903 RepID=A0A101PR12_STRCK|nr:hypothetical protein AQJ11_42430 [Streptomyces corchorusii]
MSANTARNRSGDRDTSRSPGSAWSGVHGRAGQWGSGTSLIGAGAIDTAARPHPTARRCWAMRPPTECPTITGGVSKARTIPP